ncbi:MAG: trimethylamine methyltransferase family protein [Actinobacteria bacterium]|nr:trimethylamine methyltransferase family protein [Actinomycetota bacterium]
MKLDEYKMTGGLNKEQLDKMHENALWLCENVGINIPHDGIVNILSSYGGVKVGSGNYIKFKPELVMNALKEARYDLPEYAKDEWIISAGAHQTACYDLNNIGRIKEAETKDLIDFIKLGDALDTVGSAPVVPLDVPAHLQHILMHKVAYENSRRRCNDIFEHMDKPSYECAMYVYEMAKVAGKRFAFGVWMISPRSFDAKGLEIVYRLLGKGIPMWVATMPVAGVSSPITMIGTIQQSVFEYLAGLTMLNLINKKSFNYISPNDAFEGDAFDMKYSTFVYGSVEYVEHTLYQIPLCKYYNVPIMTKAALTNSKQPDGQAAAEIGMHILIASLMGARAFRCAGLLSSGELYSGEWLVMVKEIVDYVKNIQKPQEFSEERLFIDEIAEVGPGSSFIGKKSVMQFFRQEYWMPTLFEHMNLGQWQEMGSKSMWQYAVDRAKKLITSHTYQIDPDKKKELDKIYEAAKKDSKLEDSFRIY